MIKFNSWPQIVGVSRSSRSLRSYVAFLLHRSSKLPRYADFDDTRSNGIFICRSFFDPLFKFVKIKPIRLISKTSFLIITQKLKLLIISVGIVFCMGTLVFLMRNLRCPHAINISSDNNYDSCNYSNCVHVFYRRSRNVFHMSRWHRNVNRTVWRLNRPKEDTIYNTSLVSRESIKFKNEPKSSETDEASRDIIVG